MFISFYTLNFLPLILDIQHFKDFKRHVEFSNPIPLIHDEEDEDDPKLTSCVQSISTQDLNNVYFILHP